ncbi:hypothetical protein [Massilia aerilata]|uniref:DUF4189 domain-containing protein n=1 Tax=Massilia aerilata TaxID=453817 RepID=A0ABW0S5N5_9BURK
MRTLILLLLIACTACTTCTTAAPQAQQAQQAPQSDTLARIRALAGTPGCSSDAQCHSLPLGARACGGPESYLVWSSASTSQAEIQALGERYKEERRAANAASRRVSTCQFLMDPGAVCRAGTCQPGSGGLPEAR